MGELSATARRVYRALLPIASSVAIAGGIWLASWIIEMLLGWRIGTETYLYKLVIGLTNAAYGFGVVVAAVGASIVSAREVWSSTKGFFEET